MDVQEAETIKLTHLTETCTNLSSTSLNLISLIQVVPQQLSSASFRLKKMML